MIRSTEDLIRRSIVGVVIVAAVLISAGDSQSRTLRVPSQYATIQEAIDATAEDDTVLVAPGEYRENVNIATPYNLVLISEQGPEVTKIAYSPQQLMTTPPEPPLTSYLITINASDAYSNRHKRISGFTLYGNTTYSAGFTITGRLGSNSVEFTDNVVVNNHLGVFNYTEGSSSSPPIIIKGNRVDGNAHVGIALEGPDLPAPVKVDGNLIRNSGIGISTNGITGGEITGNLVVSCGEMIVQYGVTAPRIWSVHHNTFSDNGSISSYSDIPGLVFHHNIVAYLSDFFFNYPPSDGCNLYYEMGDDPPVLAPTDIHANPEFCNRTGGDFSLSYNSPALPNGSCGLRGAREQGCPSAPVVKKCWGDLKRLYR